MAKGVRSKRVRANRAEIRNTIGQTEADRIMSATQAKLLEAVAKGGGSSLGRTAALLGGSGGVEDADVDSDVDMDDDGSKEEDDDIKVGAKTVKVGKHLGAKKHAAKQIAGTHGAHRARIAVSKSNKRGQTKHGFKITKKSGVAKKKRSKKMSKF